MHVFIFIGPSTCIYVFLIIPTIRSIDVNRYYKLFFTYNHRCCDYFQFCSVCKGIKIKSITSYLKLQIDVVESKDV